MRAKKLMPIVLLVFLCSGCLGPDRVYNGLKDWNQGLTSPAKHIVSYVLFPVYVAAITVDLLFANATYLGCKDEAEAKKGY